MFCVINLLTPVLRLVRGLLMHTQTHPKENVYKFPWMICVERILNDCRPNHFWINQQDLYLVNHKWVVQEVKQILQDQFIKKWQENMMSQSKCTVYASF